MSMEEFYEETKNYGFFALISTRKLTLKQALEEYYYHRINIEYLQKIFRFPGKPELVDG